MKKAILTLTLATCVFLTTAQNNPAANPAVWSINAAQSPIEVGQTVLTTFELGNSGNDPIPANGATFTVNFPPNVTVNQASLNLGSAASMLAPNWAVIPGTGTMLQLMVTGPGLPAFVFGGGPPMITITVQITGTVAGGTALMQTINAQPNPLIAQNANAADDNASGPIQVVPAGTLPIKLLSFTGKLADNETARLNWKVSNPDKFSHFELERSIKGAAFAKVASVKLTNAEEYRQDDDIRNIDGKILYRLRMVDLDGTSYRSNIVMLSRSGEDNNTLSLYPNPAMEKVSVTGLSGDAKYVVYTPGGQQVSAGILQAAQPDIPIGKLTSGAYWIRIAVTDGVQTLKLIKK